MNWQNLINFLTSAGMTQMEIASECGSKQATISDIQRGITQDPRSSIGMALLDLAKRKGWPDLAPKRPSK